MPRAIGFSVLVASLLAPAFSSVGAENAQLVEFARQAAGRHAYGVYFGPKKAGWAITETRVEQRDGKPVARHTEQLRFSILSFGQKSDLEMTTVHLFSLEGDGQLLEARQTMIEDGHKVVTTVKREGKQVVIERTEGERITRRRAPLPKASVANRLRLRKWLLSEPKEGATFTDYGIDLDRDDINLAEVYRYRGRRKVVKGGVPLNVFRLSVSTLGLKFEQEITSNGVLVSGKLGPLDLKAEEEATAKKLDTPSFDSLALIAVEARMGDPARVTKMVADLSGLGEFRVPASDRQRAERRGAIVRLTIDRRPKRAKEAPLTDAERKKTLAAAPSIQSDATKIKELARQIVGEEKSAAQKAQLIKTWVNRNLRQTYAANASTALRVLENRAGDCTEFSLLFVALCRAAGVPAREVGGVMYGEIDRPVFAWHAWAEIHDGRRWVSVDPMWNQYEVDATHIKLATGLEDYSFVSVMGRLKIKVVSFERDDS